MMISVVVPAYNEEQNIPVFYERVSGVLSQTTYDWEIIFVDDGSKDRTSAVVTALNQRDDRVRLLQLSRNFGSYPAISAGLLYCGGDGVVVISCDLQDPPELILEFVKKWETGADIVWGVRQERTDPGLKSMYANLFYWIVRKLIWSDFPAGGMDYGMFDRRVIDHFNQLPTRNTIPFFTIYSMGFRQERIPYHREARLHGSGNWPFFKRVKAAIDVLVDFSYVPIRSIAALGYTISLLSFAYGVMVALNRIFFGVGDTGWPSIIVVVSFLGGVQLIVLGVLGEYIWRVAEQTRERPRFFIMNRSGFEDALNPGVRREQYLPHSHAKTEIPEHTAERVQG